MPVIHLHTAEPLLGADAGQLLARRVAAALGLEPGDVIVVVIPVATVVSGTGVVAGWPSAVIHGARRDDASTRAALSQAVLALSEGFGLDPEQIWVQWCPN